jgi:calcineurin-like phosphoesterase family protein
MTIYFTADTHFGHKNILKYQNRPFLVGTETYDSYTRASVVNMDEQMIARWNETVGNGDTVYHLGDFAFLQIKQAAQIFDRLNGTKILIPGNHDSLEIQQLPWARVHPYFEINLDGKKIIMCHYAFLSWNKAHRGSLNFHGHSHGSIPPTTQRCDVGVDCWDYRPVRLDQILTCIEKAAPHVSGDYHGRE